jgi:hypothetical protein
MMAHSPKDAGPAAPLAEVATVSALDAPQVWGEVRAGAFHLRGTFVADGSVKRVRFGFMTLGLGGGRI